MAIEIYKKGQAAVTRYIAAGSIAALLGWGCYGLWKFLVNLKADWIKHSFARVPGIGFSVTPALLIALGVFVVAGFGLFLLMNRPSMADLLIDTEQEMKKVSWPTRQEAWNSTVIVIVTVIVFTVLLFSFDVMLSKVLALIFGS